MDFAKLETASLAHVDDSYFYGAYCRKCKHAARLSLEKLRKHLGEDYPLVKVKDRLRCERCRSRQIVITFLAPNQRTGSVVKLFNQPLRRQGQSYSLDRLVPRQTLLATTVAEGDYKPPHRRRDYD
jgi:hypothetical protein